MKGSLGLGLGLGARIGKQLINLFRDRRGAVRIIDAHNGHQALAKARELRPDVILTDLAVPGMDGFEFCRALQQSEETRDIPILAVTGHAEYLEQPDRFRQAGILRVLMKPCAPDVIEKELRRLLERAPADKR